MNGARPSPTPFLALRYVPSLPALTDHAYLPPKDGVYQLGARVCASLDLAAVNEAFVQEAEGKNGRRPESSLMLGFVLDLALSTTLHLQSSVIPARASRIPSTLPR